VTGRGGVALSNFDSIDFFRGDELIVDPYPYFDFLREQCPVRREPHHGVVMVTGYDEAASVYTDTETFSSCNAVTGPFPGFPVPLEGRDPAKVGELIEKHRDELPFSDQLPTMDPPEHKAHRGLLMRLLTPKRLRENEDFMWRRADRQIDEFVARGECELVSDFAGPFTLYVIADLLGVPEADHETFRYELQGGGSRGRTIGSTSKSMGHSPLEFLYDRFTTYIEDRRREPRDDVLTGLATATFPDGSTPEVIDAVRVAANLFSAGQETTVRLLAAALQVIGERPDLQKLLRDDRDRIPDFVEECLRIESPVKGDFRLARRPTTLGGVDIPAGTTVMVVNGAANRDPRRFPEPAEFQADRPNAREHLSFGRGIHSCPGGPLARAEGRVSIERLLERMGDITISEAAHGPAGARRYEYAPTYILRGLRSLHLEFTPTG
jgi:cytochrome P450